MARQGLVFFLAMTGLTVTALSMADAQTARYTMTPTADGALRLDTQTGAVALCRARESAWACESVADDRLALQSEIDRLVGENRALREQIEALVDAMPKSDGKAGQAENDVLRLPNEEDVKRLVAYLESMVRRFQDMMENLKQQNQPRERL